MRDRVTEALRDGATTINMDASRPLAHVILAEPLRQKFIKIKTSFRLILVVFSKKYPDPDKHPCTGNWDNVVRGWLDKLVNYVQYRQDFFIAVRRIVLGEMEHDSLYRDPILAMLEWAIEDVLDGKIPPREELKPDRQYWSEPPPYGGKYSIIYKIREHRKEINDILGRSNI